MKYQIRVSLEGLVQDWTADCSFQVSFQSEIFCYHLVSGEDQMAGDLRSFRHENIDRFNSALYSVRDLLATRYCGNILISHHLAYPDTFQDCGLYPHPDVSID